MSHVHPFWVIPSSWKNCEHVFDQMTCSKLQSSKSSKPPGVSPIFHGKNMPKILRSRSDHGSDLRPEYHLCSHLRQPLGWDTWDMAVAAMGDLEDLEDVQKRINRINKYVKIPWLPYLPWTSYHLRIFWWVIPGIPGIPHTLPSHSSYCFSRCGHVLRKD